MNRAIVLTAILTILLAIVLGAFGAHALKELISGEKLISFETGVRYQMYSGIALLVIGLNADRFGFNLRTFFNLNFTGLCLFSVSIYLLALQDVFGVSLRFLGPVTPVGGLLMIISWSYLLIKLVKSSK